MSRRSPDRDRDRDRDEINACRPRPSRRDGYEPGQVNEGRREWEHERDPWVPPPTGSSRTSRSPPSKPRSLSRDREMPVYRTKEVTSALESFSRTMHSTLLSTSTHALAAQHLKRMKSFPLPNTGIPLASIADAQNRFRAAEVELGDRMRELHDTFDELMKRTFGSQLQIQSKSRDKIEGLNGAEMAEARNRMRVLERRLEDIPPPPPLPSSPPPLKSRKGKEKEEILSTDSAVDGEGTKRSRARILLEDMMVRLEVVEGLKEEMEMRCTDLEDMVNAKLQDEMEIMRAGNGRWKVVEELRDEIGVIRGLKRKRRSGDREDEGGLLPPPGDIPASSLLNVNKPATETDPVVIESHEQVSSVETDRLEIAQLKAQLESLTSNTSTNANNTDAHQTITIKLLSKQVDSLVSELKTLKNGRQAWEAMMVEDRERWEKDILTKLESYCEHLVKTQIHSVVAKMATKNPSSSPAIGPTLKLPTIPPGNDLTVPTVPIPSTSVFTLTPTPHPSGASERGQGQGRPSGSSDAIPIVTPANPLASLVQIRPTSAGNGLRNGQPSSSGAAQQSSSTLQTRLQQPPAQNANGSGRASTTTPTMSHSKPLTSEQQPPGPASTSHPRVQPSPHQQNQQQHSLVENQRTSQGYIPQQPSLPVSLGQKHTVPGLSPVIDNPRHSNQGNALAEWVDQQMTSQNHPISYPLHQYPPFQPFQHSQYHHNLQHPTGISSSNFAPSPSNPNPLNRLMQIPSPTHPDHSLQLQSHQAQPPPGQTSPGPTGPPREGIRFHGIERAPSQPPSWTGQGSGILVQKMSDATGQGQGQGQG